MALISALAPEMALVSCAAGDHADPMAIRDWSFLCCTVLDAARLEIAQGSPNTTT